MLNQSKTSSSTERKIKWKEIIETVLDWLNWLFFLLTLVLLINFVFFFCLETKKKINKLLIYRYNLTHEHLINFLFFLHEFVYKCWEISLNISKKKKGKMRKIIFKLYIKMLKFGFNFDANFHFDIL